MFKRYLGPYYQNEGGGGGGGDVSALPEVPSPSDSDLDVLGADDEDAEASGEEKEGDEEGAIEEDKKESKKGKELPTGEEEEDFDIKDEKREKEEGEEKKEGEKEGEEKEETKPQGIRALTAKYPNIFKEFPDLRKTLGDYQRFRSIFTSTDEAVEVAEQAQNFLQVSDTLFNGEIGTLMDEMEQEDKGSFSKLAKNVLPTIREKDRQLYLDVTEPVLQEFIKVAFDSANSSGNNNLKNSALHLWKYLTGKTGTPEIGKSGPDPRDQEFNERVSRWERQKGEEAQSSVYENITAQMAPIIQRAIDPDNKLGEVTRKAIIKNLIGEIDAEIASDEIHMSKVGRLWQQARRAQFSQGHLSRITNAYLERARATLPKLAKKVREENGLSDNSSGRREEKKEGQQQSIERPPARLTGGRVPQPKTIRDVSPRKIDWRRTSDEDLLSGKARLKR